MDGHAEPGDRGRRGLCRRNNQTLKESLVKMLYSHPGGVPHILHVDNGKDYTAKTMTGQSRKKRNIEFEFDAETVGFYQSIGIEEVGRSLPYQPWDKPIERFFSTVCSKFSKWFESTRAPSQAPRPTPSGRRTSTRCWSAGSC